MNKSILGSTLTCGVLLLAMLSGCNNEAPSEPQPQVTATVSAQALTPAQASDLARDAWLFGMPLVMFEKQIDYSTYVTQAGEARAPINQFVHYRRFVDASNRSIVGFNVDNLYSLAWIDLRAEPLVLTVPAMG